MTQPAPNPPPNGQQQRRVDTSIVTASDEPARAISAFSSEAHFVAAQRIARAFAESTLVPQAYQGNIPNVLIAMELSNRIGASLLMVAQNLDIIHGKPTWSAKFLIATVNASGRFTPLRYRWQGTEGKDDWGCRAVAKDKQDGEECVGPLITVAVAKKEGWFEKKGSKWQTIPELMLTYRAATWWSRIFCPELSMGMQTSEEVVDVHGVTVSERTTPIGMVPGSTKELEAALMNAGVPLGTTPPLNVTADGEILPAGAANPNPAPSAPAPTEAEKLAAEAKADEAAHAGK